MIFLTRLLQTPRTVHSSHSNFKKAGVNSTVKTSLYTIFYNLGLNYCNINSQEVLMENECSRLALPISLNKRHEENNKVRTRRE